MSDRSRRVPIPPPMDELPESLRWLTPTPLGTVGTVLGDFLETGVDLISLLMFLLRISGRIGSPMNLQLVTNNLTVEVMLVDRLLDLDRRSCCYGMNPEDLGRGATIRSKRDVVVFRRGKHSDFNLACEVTCRYRAESSPPSIWHITDTRPKTTNIGPTLAIQASDITRSLRGFGHSFSPISMRPGQSIAEDWLRQLLEQLRFKLGFTCPFVESLRAKMRPEDMLIVSRLLVTIAAVRSAILGMEHGLMERQIVITVDDYAVTRRLLN
ncbi:MAG: hypothetical protein ABGZ53_14790, partial [Fuerstiella sp.]